MNYEKCATVEDVRALDDEDMSHMRACLLNEENWFLLDRLSTRDDDDGRSVILPMSGNGRWEIMTPATVGIVASVKADE
jgi:hypothetical protein